MYITKNESVSVDFSGTYNIVHPKDDDNSPFVLVRCQERPIYNIVGWQWGREAKKEEYWHDVGYGRPCYYLPNGKLKKPMELLAAMLQLQHS